MFLLFLPLKALLPFIQLHEFLECGQCLARIDALSCYLHAFLNALLSLLHHLDSEGGIGENDVLLGRKRSVFKHGIEDFLRLFLGGTTLNLFWLGNLEAQILRLEDALVIIGGYLEIAGKRNLIITIDAVYDAIVDAQLLIYLVVKAHLVEIGHTQQLALWLTRIY